MGLLKSSIYFTPTLYFLHSSFFVRFGIPFLRPDPHVLRPTRTGPVKVGRRSALAARSVVSRPRLDRPEHGGTLVVVGTMIRGELAIGRDHRATTLYSVVRSDLTMMQSCASAAKLRGGGPILQVGSEPCNSTGPRHLELSSATRHDMRTVPNCLAPSPPHCAGRRITPGGTTPSRTSRHKAITASRQGHYHPLRLPLAASVRSRYQRAIRCPFGT